MKRKTVLKRLHSKIKSFSQITPEHEYHMMKNEDGSCIKESILFTNIDKTPYKIPKDYGQGIKVDYDGKMMTSIKSNSDKPYKKCNIELTDYKNYGNYHCYGKVYVEGCDWNIDGTTTKMSSSDLSEKYPEARHNISWDIYKILTESDIVDGKGDWEGYEPGYQCPRFESVTELLLHAMYTVLDRVEGPLVFYVGASYIIPNKKDMLLVVDENDNVKLRSDIENILSK